MEDRKSSEEACSPQVLLDFYIDLIENSKNLLKYHLSEDTVLDWFGQTVKGQKNVSAFIKGKVIPVRHFFNEAKPVNKIGFRDTHQVKMLKSSRRILRSSFLSPPRLTLLNTPKKQPLPSTSTRRPISRPNLDNFQSPNNNNDKSPPSTTKTLTESPRKRQKISSSTHDIDVLESENDIPDVNVKYLTAEGHIEFHRPSLKKLQSETKWQRPCKIHIAYDSGRDVKDSSFYLIIYEGNVKCRRNLMKDFESEEPEN